MLFIEEISKIFAIIQSTRQAGHNKTLRGPGLEINLRQNRLGVTRGYWEIGSLSSSSLGTN